MRPFHILITLILSGCVTSTPTFTADGKPGHSINCSGTANTWAQCLEKAGELCGERGYVVLDRAGDQGFVFTGTQSGGFAGSTISRTMMVQCK